MNCNEEKASICALGKIFGFKPKTGLAIISHLGSAEKIFHLQPDEINALIGPCSKYRSSFTPKTLESAKKELEDLSKQGIKFIGYTDKDYPAMLKECEDAPLGLYVRSETPMDRLWKQKHIISIVGTRDVSPYGIEWCQRIVKALAESGACPLIVSGLALGTDVIAHKTALEYGLPTTAVMATGPESVYPYRHHHIADRIVRTPDCALITDYPPGTAPLAIHFLRRNRIIAGMAHSTILVESKIKGGGMITARLAFSYNRNVYALPGRNDDIRSQGCNRLIADKIAEPLISVTDIADILGIRQTDICMKRDVTDMLTSYYGNSQPESAIKIIGIIKDRGGIEIEDLAEMAKISYKTASETCRILESDGFLDIDLLQRCSINSKFI